MRVRNQLNTFREVKKQRPVEQNVEMRLKGVQNWLFPWGARTPLNLHGSYSQE